MAEKKKIMLNLLSYVVAIVLLALVLHRLVSAEQLRQLRGISWRQLAVGMLIAVAIYLFNGLNFYLMSRRVGFRMEKKDVLLLPVAMNLWGMLLPFQGAMAYNTVFLKRKYGVTVADSFSMLIFMYALVIFLAGFFGVIFVLIYGIKSSWFLLLSLLFCASPLGILAADAVLGRIPEARLWGPLRPVYRFIRRTVGGIGRLCRDRRTVGILLGIYCLRMLALLLLYAWIVRLLGYGNISLLAMLLLNLWNGISLLIKFTPQNLGVSQLVAGGLFALIGLSPEEGVMISLFETGIFSLVALTVGVAATVYSARTVIRGAQAGDG